MTPVIVNEDFLKQVWYVIRMALRYVQISMISSQQNLHNLSLFMFQAVIFTKQ
jgi:hypothetical protein